MITEDISQPVPVAISTLFENISITNVRVGKIGRYLFHYHSLVMVLAGNW